VTVSPFIEAEKAAERNVARACELLEVSRSAYYAQRNTTPSPRKVEEAELTAAIVRLHEASKGVYGAPKIHDELKDEGRQHGRKRVARIMREHGLRGKTPKRFKTTTIADPQAAARADLIKRDFTIDATKINTRWCGDITYIPTWQGWLYLATSSTSPAAGSLGSRWPITCAPSSSATRSPTPSRPATLSPA
jgi:transposase InsO family protein